MQSDNEVSPAILFVSPVIGRPITLADRTEQLGLEVLAAIGCRDARSVLRSRTGIEVVIVDVTLPDGNWCEILRWMIENRVDARVILVSPVSDASLWSEAVWRGAYDVLVEPFASWEFSRSVEGALRNRSHHRDAPLFRGAGSAAAHRPSNLGKKQRQTSHLITPAILPAASLA